MHARSRHAAPAARRQRSRASRRTGAGADRCARQLAIEQVVDDDAGDVEWGHALQTLPTRIAALHATIASLGTKLADPGLYTRDRASFQRFSADLAAAETALAPAEEEWLTLEILREEIEGAG